MSSDRRTLIYIEQVEGVLYPKNDLYPDDDIYPNAGTVIIGEASDIYHIGIVSGSLQVDEVLMDSSLTFGKCCSNKFEVELFNVSFDFAKKRITVVQRLEDTEVPVFTGIIDSSERDNTGVYRNIVAYDDYYYKKDTDVTSWWNKLWEDNQGASYSIKTLREGLLKYVGIAYEDVTLINDDITLSNPEKTISFDNITLDTLLSYLCEFSFCVPNMNRQGVMEFVVLDTESPRNIVGTYENSSNTTYEDYVTSEITGIQLYEDSNAIGQVYGDETNAYAIEANVFMLNMSAAEVDTVLSRILNYIKGVKYTPATIRMIESDWSLKLGDFIQTETGNHYIMENTFSDCLLVEQDIQCVANGATLDNQPTNSRTFTAYSGKVSKLEKTVDNFTVEFTENYTTKDETNEVETSLSSKIDTTAESITAEVSKTYTTKDETNEVEKNLSASIELKVDKDDVVSQINASADVITLDAGRLLINSGNFTLNKEGTVVAKAIDIEGGSINISTSSETESVIILNYLNADPSTGFIANTSSKFSPYVIETSGEYQDGTKEGVSLGPEGISAQYSYPSGDSSNYTVNANGLYIDDTISGSTGFGNYSSSRCYLEYGGNYIKGTVSGGWTKGSDERLKENIEDIDTKELLNSIRPVSFKYKSSEGKHFGFIAQEVEKAFNEYGAEDAALITKPDDDTKYYGLDYNEFVAILWKICQSQQAEIDALKAIINKED